MKELEKLILIMKSLRDPERGCPWDREQTIESIRGYTLEEAYEVVDAIERQSMSDLRDELGDLLFHIIFYAEMAAEQGAFDFREVTEKVAEKLERRHPHVFSDLNLETSDEVKRHWERTKQQERQSSNTGKQYLLDDISRNLPAILRAWKLQKRAAGVGFDWPDAASVVEKMDEEMQELKETVEQDHDIERITEELGDLMFCCVNLARYFNIDPELALRKTNEKFVSRFNYIEQTLAKKNKTLQDSELAEMDALWDEAKLNG